MARRRSGIAGLRSELYHAARVMGDVQAISQGPGAYAKRYVRRRVYSRSMGATGSILRALNMTKHR
jgi:hypothetical protein